MTTTYEPNMILKQGDYKVIGTRPVRHDGADKVTGRAKYGADFHANDILHAKFVRSPHAHAKILSIDTSEAESMDGVHAVVTGADLPEVADQVVALGEGAANLRYLRNNVLADDKALYKGHAIAAVAASSPHVAEDAADKIKVEYEVLDPVLTAPEGMADGAPILDEALRTSEMGETAEGQSNVAEHFRQVKGDVEEGFAQADLIVEREFDTSTVHQGYIEPQVATGLWNTDDRITIWCSTQGSFSVRDEMVGILSKPASQIKVVPMEIGGGFGGKIPAYLEPTVAVLSKKSGRPVKAVMTRQEVFEATGPTPGSHMTVKIGVDNDGNILAAQTDLQFEAGAFPGSPVGAAAMCVFATYDIPNQQIDGYDVVVNKPKSQAYRAPGSTNVAFATETVLNEIAEKLGIDPVDLRLKNVATKGTTRADGVTFPRIGAKEVLEAMRDHPHYSEPLDGPNKGRGVGVGYWFNVGFKSAVNISVNPDGTINLTEGSTDIGGTRASVAMQAAEVLGIRAEDVNPTVVDTDSIGHTDVTGGSRVTYATGWAAYEAAQDVKRQMIARAALIWDVDRRLAGDGGRRISVEGRRRAQHDLRRACRAVERHRRSHHGPGRARHGRPRRRWRLVRRKHRRCGGRPRHRQGRHPAVHRRPGRGQGHPPQLRRGTDAGRKHPGNRMGAQRRVLHARRRHDDELDPPRLSDADQPRPSDDRHRYRRGAQRAAALRRPRRRRGQHRPAARRHRSRHLRRNGRQNAATPDESRRRHRRKDGERQLASKIPSPVVGEG